MQVEWLKRYMTQQHQGCQHEHGTEAEGAAAEQEEGGVSRRDFVKTGFAAGMAAGMAAGHVIGQPGEAEADAHGQWDFVLGDQWWPSEWGPDDEAGASNRITPAKVLQAASLIRKGKIYRLGRVLEAGVPLFGARHVSITIPGAPTGGPFGAQQLMYNDEMFSGEIGQVGSQFDGLGHIGAKVGDTVRYYNGFTQDEVGGAYGLQKLGIQNCKPFFTRGILLDVASMKGEERLPIGYVITMNDVADTLSKQGISEPGEGYAVMFRTAMLSGGLAGMAGVSEVAGLKGYLTLDLSPGFGYAGIAVAMLVQLHPIGVIASAIFLSAIFVGADSMSRASNVPSYIADVVTAVSLLLVLVSVMLTRYRIRWT